MRGIDAATAAARQHARLPSSYAAAFSSFPGIGGGAGAGRGRGRGLSPFGPPCAPGRPIPNDDDDDGADPFSTPSPIGRGRGGGVVPSFSAFLSAGHGSPPPPPSGEEGEPKEPSFTSAPELYKKSIRLEKFVRLLSDKYRPYPYRSYRP